jgi:hypothetical protein
MTLSVASDYLTWENREAVTLTGARAAGGSLLTGLAAYYRLGEASGDAADSSGNARTLTQHGGVGSAAGKLGNARSFAAASGQYLFRGAPFWTSGQFGVSLWLWLTTPSAPQFVWQQDGTPLGPPPELVVAAGVPQFTAGDSNSVSGPAPAAQTWVHLVCVYDGAGIRLYRDGSLAGSLNGAAADFTGASAFYLGASAGTAALDGRLDEVAVYSRALTAAEVLRLYNGGAGYDPTVPDDAAVADARRFPVRRHEQAASGGVYRGDDRVWCLPAAQCSFEPLPADRVTDSAGTVWTVLEAKPVGLGSSLSHYRLVTRDLVLAAGLRDVLDVERPAITYDASGVALRAWSAAYSGIPCRVQPQEAVAVEERGLYGFRGTHLGFVDRQLTLTAEDRLNVAGVYYEVKGWRNAQRIDELFTIDAELVP